MRQRFQGWICGILVADSLFHGSVAAFSPPPIHARAKFTVDPDLLRSGDPCDVGYHALAERNFDRALAVFDDVLAKDTRNPRAHRLRGVALTFLGQLADAQAALDISLAIQDDAEIRAARATLCLRRNDPHGAEREIEASLRSDPTDQDVRLNLVRLRKHRGDLDEADRTLREAVAVSGRSAKTLVFEAALKLDRGRLDDARVLLKEATRLDPSDAEAWRWRGRTSIRQMRVADAIRDFTRAIELLPEDAELWDFLGIAYYYVGSYEDADCALIKAIACEPDGADLYLHRSAVRAARSEFTAALQDAEEAMRLSPSNGLARRWHACLRLCNGDVSGAAEELDRLILERPADTEAAAMLCLSHYWRGAPRRGIDAARTCRSHGGDGASLAAGLALCLAADGKPADAIREAYRGASAYPYASMATVRLFLANVWREQNLLRDLIERRERHKARERVAGWQAYPTPFIYLVFDSSQLRKVNCRRSL